MINSPFEDGKQNVNLSWGMAVRKRRFMELKIEFICQRNATRVQCSPLRPRPLNQESHLYQVPESRSFSYTNVY